MEGHFSPFPLDFGFWTLIWEMDLRPGFGTWIRDLDLGLDLVLTILKWWLDRIFIFVFVSCSVSPRVDLYSFCFSKVVECIRTSVADAPSTMLLVPNSSIKQREHCSRWFKMWRKKKNLHSLHVRIIVRVYNNLLHRHDLLPALLHSVVVLPHHDLPVPRVLSAVEAVGGREHPLITDLG